MRNLFTILVVLCCSSLAFAQTYTVNAYVEDFSDGFSIQGDEGTHNIRIDGQEGFHAWQKNNTGDLDNNNWWKVQGSQGFVYISNYQGPDYSYMVLPKLDLSDFTDPKFNFAFTSDNNAGGNAEVKVYYSTSYNGTTEFSSVPSSFTLLKTFTGNSVDDANISVSLPASSSVYVLFAYSSSVGNTPGSGADFQFDNFVVGEEFTEPTTYSHFSQDFSGVAGGTMKNVTTLETTTGMKFFQSVAGKNWYSNNYHVVHMLDFQPAMDGVTSWIVSPKIDLSGCSFAKLEYNAAFKFAVNAEMGVYYSTDWDGSSDPNANGTWTPIEVTGTPSASLTQWRAGGAPYDASTDANYASVSGLLVDACDAPSVYIGFKGVSLNGGGWHYLIDNIDVRADVEKISTGVISDQEITYSVLGQSGSLRLNNFTEAGSVCVYSVEGKEIYSKEVSQNENLIVPVGQKGMYLVKFNSGLITSVKKVIVY